MLTNYQPALNSFLLQAHFFDNFRYSWNIYKYWQNYQKHYDVFYSFYLFLNHLKWCMVTINCFYLYLRKMSKNLYTFVTSKPYVRFAYSSLVFLGDNNLQFHFLRFDHINFCTDASPNRFSHSNLSSLSKKVKFYFFFVCMSLECLNISFLKVISSV